MAARSSLVLAAFAVAGAAGAHACGSYGEDDSTSSALGDGGGDPADATTADGTSAIVPDAVAEGGNPMVGCSIDDPFGDPVLVENTDSFGAVTSLRLDRSGANALLSMDIGGADGFDIREVEYPIVPFALPHTLRSTPAAEHHPAPLTGGLKVFFDQDFDGGARGIFSATRSNPGQNLGPPVAEIVLNGTRAEMPWSVGGNEILYFVVRTATPNSADIQRAVRSGGAWLVNAVLPGAFDETHPVVTDDETVVYFAQSASGGKRTIWYTTRATATSEWSARLEIPGAVNAPNANNEPSWISPDGCTLFIASDRSGASKPYKVARTKQ